MDVLSPGHCHHSSHPYTHVQLRTVSLFIRCMYTALDAVSDMQDVSEFACIELPYVVNN